MVLREKTQNESIVQVQKPSHEQMKMQLDNQLKEAIYQQDLSQVVALLNQTEPPLDINAQHSMNLWTPLHWACYVNSPSMVSILLSKGANPTITNKANQTPADLAKDPEIRSLLLSNYFPGSSSTKTADMQLDGKPNMAVTASENHQSDLWTPAINVLMQHILTTSNASTLSKLSHKIRPLAQSQTDQKILEILLQGQAILLEEEEKSKTLSSPESSPSRKRRMD